jgi:hypothetical protein
MERLRALPEPQRAALVMRELEGLSHEEIAAALGVSGGAARQAIYRARATLREGLGFLLPLPALRMLTEHGAEMVKAGTATVLLAGAVGAGVAVEERERGSRSEAAQAAPLVREAGEDRGHIGQSEPPAPSPAVSSSGGSGEDGSDGPGPSDRSGHDGHSGHSEDSDRRGRGSGGELETEPEIETELEAADDDDRSESDSHSGPSAGSRSGSGSGSGSGKVEFEEQVEPVPVESTENNSGSGSSDDSDDYLAPSQSEPTPTSTSSSGSSG